MTLEPLLLHCQRGGTNRAATLVRDAVAIWFISTISRQSVMCWWWMKFQQLSLVFRRMQSILVSLQRASLLRHSTGQQLCLIALLLRAHSSKPVWIKEHIHLHNTYHFYLKSCRSYLVLAALEARQQEHNCSLIALCKHGWGVRYCWALHVWIAFNSVVE